MATFSDWLEEKIKEEEQKNKGPSMSFSNWTNKEKAQGTLKSSVDFNAHARGPLFSGTNAVSPAPATSSTLAKSNTDLQLEGLKANAIAQSDGNVWDEETLRLNRLQNERAKLLSYMTNAQKNQYNAKEQNARDAYIDSIRNDLNKKQGEDYAKEILNEKDKGNQFAKTTALGLSSGVRSFGSGMKGAINAVIGDEKETVTRGAAQHAFNAIRPELEGTQMVAADLANMVGNMAPSVLASVIGAPVGLGFLGTVGMGLSSGGNAYDEAIEQGYDRNKARLYGAASGIKEVALQKILGSLPGINKTGGVVKKLVGGMSDDVLAKIISSPNVRQAFIDAVASGFSESLEETTQDIIDIPLRNVIFGEKNKIDPKELGYTALLSFLTGEAFNAPGTFKTLSNKNNGIETAQPTPETAQPTPETAQPTPETAQPTPETTQPTPETIQPTPETVENTVDAVQNDVDAVQNDVEMLEEVTEESTAAETEPVVEADEEVIESKPITDAVKRTVKAVNPNAENSQQIYRQIMANNGYGKLVKIMDKIAKRFGTEVQYYADDTGSEGYNFNNKIYLNINNMRDSADAIWKLFKHELTHSLEGTDAYGKLLKSRAGAELFNKFLIDKGYTVTDEKGNVSASIDALANEISELYRRNGVELDPQGLNHEMVARFIEESDLFENEDSIRRLAQESPDFVHSILRWIKDTIANIGADADTRNLRNAERMFERALDQAVKGEFKYQKDGGKEYLFVRGTEDQNRLMDVLEKKGMSREEIWKETGLIRDTKGNVITEINDKDAKFYPNGDLTFRKDHPEYARYEDLYSKLLYEDLTESELAEFKELGEIWGRERERLKERFRNGNAKLGDVFEHDKLYEVMPELADVPIRYVENLGAWGERSSKGISLSSQLDASLREAAVLHEVQHEIQAKEDRPGGSNPEYWQNRISNGESFGKYDKDIKRAEQEKELAWMQMPEEAKTKVREINREMIKARETGNFDKVDELEAAMYNSEYADLYEDYASAQWELEMYTSDNKPLTANELYRNTGGEIESKQTENRMHLTDEERRNKMPDLGWDRAWFADHSGRGFSINDVAWIDGMQGQYAKVNDKKQYSFSTDSNGRQLTPEQQEYFKDSKAVDTEGRLLALYHQTENEFTVFDTKHKGAGTSDSGTPFGIFLKSTNSDIGLRGKNQMALYADIKNPLTANNRDELTRKLKSLSPEYDAITEKHKMLDTEYKEKFETAKRDFTNFIVEWRKNNPDASRTALYDVPEFNKLFEAEDILVKEWGEKADALSVEAKEILTQTLRDNGYDGVILKNDAGSFGRSTDAYIALDPQQVKNIDNAKPTNNPDIRYSFKDDGKLNAKSKDYVYKDIVDSFKEITGASRLKGSPEIREAINAYAEGSVDAGVNKDVLGSIFDKMWQAADKTVPMSYDNAKNEFFNKIENYEKDIKDVTRYNNAREAKAALKAERSDTVEKILADKKFSKTFFKDYTAARRAYDKLTRKVMLTPDDTNIMRQLSEGTISWDEVERRSDEFNVDAIKKVYDAYNTKHKFESIEKELKAKVTGEYRSEAEDLIENSDAWEDKPMGAMYSRETMERNIEDITKKGNNKNRRNEDAYWINKTYFKPVHENEAKSTRLKNELGAKVKALQLGTKPMYTVMIRNEYTGMPVQTEVSESGLVQLYGEGLINDNTLERLGADKEKIHKAVNEFRGIYNQLIEMANETLIRNGYRPVEYRKDYFPHFTENKPDSTLGKVAAYFGIEMRADELPTDIAGITHTFRPGKKWVGNFLERKTKVTDYDALKGFDRYINGAADVIFHTDDIQRLRALESALRYKYSDEGTKKRIKEIEDSTTLTPEEKKSLIEDIMKANETSHLPNLVTEIRNYTDNLAGKKSISDRNWEHAMGRGLYNFTKKMENRVSANMVALNPGSWLTNFIPITQVSGIVDPKKLARAIWDTSKGAAKTDGFRDRSDFLVNRKGSEMTFKTTTDKIQDTLTKPFSLIDSFSAEVVTRALYYDKMAEVENEAEALEYANDMAARVMADRSKGAKPTAFNAQNPVAKLFTMFQVEVNNQYSYMFKDVPADLRKKGLASIAWAFVKMFLGAYLYNEVYEKYIGRRAAFDPVDIMASAIGDFTNPDVKKSQAVANAAADVVDELPFVSGILGGGRVPISSALPSVSKLNEAGVGLISGEMNSKKAAQQLGKELIKPAAYLVPPVGGGQIKKAIEGISTVAKGGEVTYDNEGNEILKYPIEDKSALKYLQAGLFGKSSLKESQDYYNNGMPTLTVKQTQNYHKAVEAGINYKQYMAALQASKGAESDKDKDGKTIALSLAKNKKAAIDEAVKEFNLSKKQKELLYEANDVSEKVW